MKNYVQNQYFCWLLVTSCILLASFNAQNAKAEYMGECEDMRHYILENVKNGWLIRNVFTEGFLKPKKRAFYAELKGLEYSSTYPIYLIDVDKDGLYELIHSADIFFHERHVETRVYYLMKVPRNIAEDLINNPKGSPRRSKYYHQLMAEIYKKYGQYLSQGISNVDPVGIYPSSYFPDAREDGVYRITLMSRGEKEYFVIDDVVHKQAAIVLIESFDLPKFTHQCTFSLIK